MQTACIEYARNVCGLVGANSGEFDPATSHRIIYKLRELTGVEEMGGTMRLGAWACVLEPGSLAEKAYGTTEISERHRHRYEFNREYEAVLTGAGLRLTGTTPDSTYVEIVEIPTHPFFLGCQFHPEFKSKPLEPHPLFKDFVGASYKNRKVAVVEGVAAGDAGDGTMFFRAPPRKAKEKYVRPTSAAARVQRRRPGSAAPHGAAPRVVRMGRLQLSEDQAEAVLSLQVSAPREAAGMDQAVIREEAYPPTLVGGTLCRRRTQLWPQHTSPSRRTL